MTKSDLIARMAARHPQLFMPDAELTVKTILAALTNSIVAGQRVEIRGFGSFYLHRRPPRIGRNPKTGESVHVPEKSVPHFKAGKEMRERVHAGRTASASRGTRAQGRSMGMPDTAPLPRAQEQRPEQA